MVQIVFLCPLYLLGVASKEEACPLSNCFGKNDSSAECSGYLNVVVTPHLCSRYATRKNKTPCYHSRYITTSHRTLHIRHANASVHCYLNLFETDTLYLNIIDLLHKRIIHTPCTSQAKNLHKICHDSLRLIRKYIFGEVCRSYAIV